MPARKHAGRTTLPYNVTVIGTGRAGRAVARLLHKAGCAIECVVNRSAQSAKLLSKELHARITTTDFRKIPSTTNFILISVTDENIGEVAAALAENKQIAFRRLITVHLSGALTRDALKPLQIKGATTLALHPAFPFSSLRVMPEQLKNIGWGVECDTKDRLVARRIIEAFRGVPIRVSPKNKILYHAACTIASNFLVVLEDAALQLLAEAGISPRNSRHIIQPLVQATVNNISGKPDLPINKKITGPAARGDAQTIYNHMQTVAYNKDIEKIYRDMTAAAIEIVKRNKNLRAEAILKMEKILHNA